MQENSITYLKNLKHEHTDSPFVSLVVNFLLRHKNKGLPPFPVENKIDIPARINALIEQLIITRVSKDDNELRNACIEAGKNMQNSRWTTNEFKKDLIDIVHSEIRLASAKDQEMLTKTIREKISLIENLSSSEAMIQQLIQENTRLKSKIMVLEQDVEVVKKEIDFEKKLNAQSSTETNQLRYSVLRLKRQVEELDKQITLAKSAGFIERTHNTQYISTSSRHH